MNPSTYTSIPDTSDMDYWELKASDLEDRSKTFVPRDKDLHRALMIKQREEADRRLIKKKQLERSGNGSSRSKLTNKQTWLT